MDYRFAFLLLAVQILSTLSQGEAQFGNGESPYQPPGGEYLHPPYGNGTIPHVNCSELICGEGTCNSSFESSNNGSSWSYSYSYNYTSGSLCECNKGWMPFDAANSFISTSQYRPCVIPNCTFQNIADKCNFTLPKKELPDPANETALLDPCAWTDCWMGTCLKISQFRYECSCHEGFMNLFNDKAFPCMNECMITKECEEKTGAKFAAKSTAGGDGGSQSNGKGGDGGGGVANILGRLLGLLLTMMCIMAMA